MTTEWQAVCTIMSIDGSTARIARIADRNGMASAEVDLDMFDASIRPDRNIMFMLSEIIVQDWACVRIRCS